MNVSLRGGVLDPCSRYTVNRQKGLACLTKSTRAWQASYEGLLALLFSGCRIAILGVSLYEYLCLRRLVHLSQTSGGAWVYLQHYAWLVPWLLFPFIKPNGLGWLIMKLGWVELGWVGFG